MVKLWLRECIALLSFLSESSGFVSLEL